MLAITVNFRVKEEFLYQLAEAVITQAKNSLIAA